MLIRVLHLLVVILPVTLCAQDQDFVTAWRTDIWADVDSTSITIPTIGDGYNYDVDWNNDLVFDQIGITGSVNHDYGVPGIYRVRIRGNFPRIFFSQEPDAHKIIEVEQWGSIHWKSMEGAFDGCVNLRITAHDAPDLSGVESMKYMFRECHALNESLDHWDVSHVTNMVGLFATAESFNQNISSWDVSQVTRMDSMFYRAWSFNQNIGEWDVAQVISMRLMFFEAVVFNQDIGTWDVSNVTDMAGMFSAARRFNKAIGDWNVSKVDKMNAIFSEADDFNQDINGWDVSQVTNMTFMFSRTKSFNQSLDHWNVSSVLNMNNMFRQAAAFNGSIGTWNTSNCSQMELMFYSAVSFNQDIGSWDVSNVTTMAQMFYADSSFNQDISNWNVSKVVNMRSMFELAPSFNQNIGLWNTGSLKYMQGMFSNARSFNQNLGRWDISKSPAMHAMFYHPGLSVENYDSTLIGWENQGVMNLEPGPVYGMHYCHSLEARNSLLNSLNWHFYGDVYDCSVGLPNEFVTDIDFFPNPTHENIYTRDVIDGGVKVFDVLGKIMEVKKMEEKRLDLSDLSSGVYFIQFQYHDRIVVKEIIKE